MSCKRHTFDLSSNIGVCASCLRESLFYLAASTAASQNRDHNRQSQSQISPPPSLLFPRTVSPYVAPRKSDAGGGDSLPSYNNRFFSTPQIGPTTNRSHGGGESSSSEKIFESAGKSFNKKRSGLSRFSSFFRTRSDDFETRSNRDSCDASAFSPSSSSSSRSWLSNIISVKSRKQLINTNGYIEDLIDSESDQHIQRNCRGMSPATEMETPGRRKTAAIGISKTVSGMGFCLSPLVRAKPKCSFITKGRFTPDFGYSGELKSPAKPHVSTAASFCSNRSKKLVDLGRVDHRR